VLRLPISSFLLMLILLLMPSRHPAEPVRPKPEEKKKVESYHHIDNFVLSTVGTKKKPYAKKVSSYIVKYSNKYNVPPELVAAVGYTESRFSMDSRPCVGVMQVYLPTYRNYDKKTGLDPYKLEDNIHLGVRELARYYHARGMVSRGGDYRLRRTLSRYNGCGLNGAYVRKTLGLYNKLKEKKNGSNNSKPAVVRRRDSAR